MKHLAWAFLFLGMSIPVVSAPIYRAGESSSSTLVALLHGEVSADYQFTSQKMKAKLDDSETSSLKGWNVRALWTPLRWLSVGAEMTRFGDEEIKEAFISSYKTNRVAGLVKLTLSPSTSPRVYVLGGYGYTHHQLNYDHSINPIAMRKWPANEKKNIPYWIIGLGIEVDVWKVMFVGVEGNYLRHQTTKLPHSQFYKTDSQSETQVRVRVGVRF